MNSIFRSRRAIEVRSGGKMVRPRRTTGPQTPYDRPRPQFTGPRHENPNWISRLILSPTRMVVTGAGKLLSAVFSPSDSSSSSSSSYSSSSSSDFGSVSGDAIEDNYGANDVSSQFADRLEKRNRTSRMIESFNKDCLPIVGDRGKHVIEQLLMQKTFTREECNKLIKIIKSRVVDNCANEDKGMLYKTIGDTDNRDLCSTAIMEARKWLTEKKVGSASKLDLDNVVEDEMGSPVDMAKSFMQERPLWLSPSFNHGEHKSSSTILAPLPQRETPYSIGKATSLSKPKRDTPTTGSWNIQEEIQRVRAKATEEMLRNLPSKRVDWSVSSLDKNTSTNSLVSESIEADVKDKMQSSTENADTSLHTTAEKSISHELHVLELTQDGLQNEASHDRVNVISWKNQDLEAVQITYGNRGPKDILEDLGNTEHQIEASQDVTIISHRDNDADVHGHEDNNAADQQLSNMGEGNMEDPRSQERNCSMPNEVTGSRIDNMTNGFPSSGYRLSAEVVDEHNDLQNQEEQNLVSSIDNMATGVRGDETCKFLTETSMEIPNMNDTVDENGSIASGTQNGFVKDNELPRIRTRPTSMRSPVTKTSDLSKPQAKRLTRYNKRSRGRGK